MLFGEKRRCSLRMVVVAGVIGVWQFGILSLLYGDVFGPPYWPAGQQFSDVIGAITLTAVVGLTGFHSAQNEGLLVSWLLGTAFVFASIVHLDLRFSQSITFIYVLRSVWEAVAFGILLGSFGFFVGTVATYLRIPSHRSQVSPQQLLVLVGASIALGLGLFPGCQIVFDGTCFRANAL